MSGLKWNTGKLYYSTVELGNQHQDQDQTRLELEPEKTKGQSLMCKKARI